jgi:hypothetical protein
VESGSDNGVETVDGDKPAIGAGHEERTPAALRDMRKSKIFGAASKAFNKSLNYGERAHLAMRSFHNHINAAFHFSCQV